MLAKIERRLQQTKNNILAFGGIFMILIGDPGQLFPVCASSLYSIKIKGKTQAMAGQVAYKKFQIVITLVLEVIMRQKINEKDPNR